jgi:hypothetical protein
MPANALANRSEPPVRKWYDSIITEFQAIDCEA